MKYYLYSSNESKTTTDDLLTYIDMCIQDDIDDEVEFTVVTHLLQMIIDGRVLPCFIDLSIENMYHMMYDTIVDDGNRENYIEFIQKLMQNDSILKQLYYDWTENEELPLVVVSEDDICAPFILRMFPPFERYL
jgi:hypothetical protein